MAINNQYTQQKYLNLETFRKNGVGVKTPVWFVIDEDTVFVRTMANSGKVKRIRNNGQVNIAPCKSDGALIGTWNTAQAREVKDEEVGKKVDHLLDKKYGLLKKMFALAASINKQKYTVIELKTIEES